MKKLHPETIKTNPEQYPEFDNHQSLSLLHDPKTGLKGFIAIHRRNGKPSFGATRFWRYASEGEALRDALRLSRLMTYKSVMAGFRYGGAKAVIIDNKRKPKESVLISYTDKLNGLSGKFITGTDVGLDLRDLKMMRDRSQYLVGVKSNPEKFTALGLYYGIQVTLKEIYGSDSLKGVTLAIQGIGKVGYEFLKMAYKEAKQIYVSDTNYDRVRFIKKLFPKVIVVSYNAIHTKTVDIYMPCALSYALNKKTIREMNCKAIVGAANNQLESPAIGAALHERGILYAPDYVVNAGGLISVIDEYETDSFNEKRIEKKVLKIKETLTTGFSESRNTRKPPSTVCDAIAENLIQKHFGSV